MEQNNNNIHSSNSFRELLFSKISNLTVIEYNEKKKQKLTITYE